MTFNPLSGQPTRTAAPTGGAYTPAANEADSGAPRSTNALSGGATAISPGPSPVTTGQFNGSGVPSTGAPAASTSFSVNPYRGGGANPFAPAPSDAANTFGRGPSLGYGGVPVDAGGKPLNSSGATPGPQPSATSTTPGVAPATVPPASSAQGQNFGFGDMMQFMMLMQMMNGMGGSQQGFGGGGGGGMNPLSMMLLSGMMGNTQGASGLGQASGLGGLGSLLGAMFNSFQGQQDLYRRRQMYPQFA